MSGARGVRTGVTDLPVLVPYALCDGCDAVEQYNWPHAALEYGEYPTLYDERGEGWFVDVRDCTPPPGWEAQYGNKLLCPDCLAVAVEAPRRAQQAEAELNDAHERLEHVRHDRDELRDQVKYLKLALETEREEFSSKVVLAEEAGAQRARKAQSQQLSPQRAMDTFPKRKRLKTP